MFFARAVLIVICVGTANAASAVSFHERLAQANDLLKQGLFDQAVPALEEMKVDYPDQPVLDYALGSAQYQRAMGLGAAGKGEEAVSAFKDAETRFSGVSTSANHEVSVAAAFGRANAVAKLAELQANPEKYQEGIAALRNAEAAYLEVLKREPGHAGAQKNLDHVRLVLKQLLQNPPAKQDQQEQQQQQQKEPPKPQPKVISVFRGASTELPGAKATADGATVTLQAPVTTP